MSKYVLSDIHGRADLFYAMLERICFSLCEEPLVHYRAILPEYSLSMEHSCTVAGETYAIFGYHRQALSHYAEALKINKVLNRKSRNLKDRLEIQKRRKQLH